MSNPNPRYVVDGHEFEDVDSAWMGDGEFPPFAIFDTEKQDNLTPFYATRAEAEAALKKMIPHTFTFDVKAFFAVTVEAKTEAEARAMIATMDGSEVNIEGQNVILSFDGDHDLTEIDGEGACDNCGFAIDDKGYDGLCGRCATAKDKPL